MLYHLFSWLEANFQPPGLEAFQFVSTRAAFAAATALLISLLFGKKMIAFLQRLQLQETIRDDIGLDNHLAKAGTPTMGGIIIIVAITIPAMLWMDITSSYFYFSTFVLLALGGVGFIDDYIKTVKKDKSGLSGRFKIAGQVTVGLILAIGLYLSPLDAGTRTLTMIPFFKNYYLDYGILGDGWSILIYAPVVIFIVTAVSNAVNLTDGLDGLASGISAIVAGVLAVIAYVSGRVDFSQFLNILYLPGAPELSTFATSIFGACLGFLWYNTHPAQVFMGDTGSLALGSGIASLAIMLHKELLLPIVCGVFFFETVSVILQTSWFKYTKRKNGEGKRLFLMAPIHHHFEKKGWAESKIVVRFWLISILLAIFSLLTFKLR